MCVTHKLKILIRSQPNLARSIKTIPEIITLFSPSVSTELTSRPIKTWWVKDPKTHGWCNSRFELIELSGCFTLNLIRIGSWTLLHEIIVAWFGFLSNRSVHKSGQVEFVPDSDSTWTCLVGENGTRNQLGMLVRSAGLGRVGLRVVPVGFGFHCRCRRSGRIRRDLARSRWDLTESQHDLARSHRI